ncbi:DUF5060 domain-containing protein [Paenibacillus rhizovicinus]|uniref:DUF5060 domain-containing protein n=1 Tax=Paenibacillus rhizovicinus TaxID=2704463 RepID=A0A6C0PA48_9BACL|nr:DUF5060 domain-containing protein [Paenibacillus rhizovicinus]QHW34503.1 DUF5060 domain-containing protein [Paenibacillus rhizovicinus]
MNKRTLVLLSAGGILTVTAALLLFMPLINGENKSPPSEPQAQAGETLTKEGKAVLIRDVKANTTDVGLYEKFELALHLDGDFDNPYDPDQIDLSMALTSPSGKKWNINGFYDETEANWKLRFAPDEIGKWTYRFRATGHGGADKSSEIEGEFQAAASDRPGWIQLSQSNKRYLEYRNGSSFYGVGLAYPWNITDENLDKIAASGGNLITYWNGNYDNEGNGGGKNQLQSFEAGVDKIDPLKAQRVDDLLAAFERRGLHMSFVIWPHDSLTDQLEGWPNTWSQNGYSALGPAKDFYSSQEMWKYQERLYRYVIARWGYSQALGIWDLVDEINGTDGWTQNPTEVTDAWVAKVHAYFKANDPYGHPTMGSMAGNRQDYWDFAYRTLDLADRENYYNFSYDSFAKDIRKRWDSYEKPLMIGETGNIVDTEKYHQAIWVSLTNGLASIPVWWDFDHVSDEMFAQMKVLAAFAAKIDFHEPRIPVNTEVDAASKGQTWVMQGKKLSFGWLLTEKGEAGGKNVNLMNWEDGSYTVVWYDPWTGTAIGENAVKAKDGSLVMKAPASIQKDIAFTITRK